MVPHSDFLGNSSSPLTITLCPDFVNRHFRTVPPQSTTGNSNISPELFTSTHVFVCHDAPLNPPSTLTFIHSNHLMLYSLWSSCAFSLLLISFRVRHPVEQCKEHSFIYSFLYQTNLTNFFIHPVPIYVSSLHDIGTLSGIMFHQRRCLVTLFTFFVHSSYSTLIISPLFMHQCTFIYFEKKKFRACAVTEACWSYALCIEATEQCC